MSHVSRPRIAHRRARGFTLIEIMVVVIIIGLLAAIVAPNVIGRISEAEITKAKAEIGNLENAINLFCVTFGPYLIWYLLRQGRRSSHA